MSVLRAVGTAILVALVAVAGCRCESPHAQLEDSARVVPPGGDPDADPAEAAPEVEEDAAEPVSDDSRPGAPSVSWSFSPETLDVYRDTRVTFRLENAAALPETWRFIWKFGDGAPWGQVFRSRQVTKEVWKPGQESSEDLVLTRVLLLAGEEPGVNQGGNVDSTERCIYIHGTNQEERIGQPSSHGCVRLRNDDVIEAFDWIPEGTPVLISEMEG